LREDKKTIDKIEEQLQLFATEMKRDFQLQQQRLDNILYELTERGNNFFEEFLQLSNVADLLKKNVVAQMFQTQVLRNVISQIESHISEVIDWIMDRKYRQWKAVTDFVYKRARTTLSEEKLVGSLKSDFNFNRKELLFNIGSAAEDVVERCSNYADTDKLNENISKTLKSMTAFSVSAISAGTATIMLTPTISATALGLVGAAAMLASGFYILPFKRAKMRKEFVANVEMLRHQLHSVMTEKLNNELSNSVENIRAAISPYSSFVSLEYERFTAQKKTLQEIKTAIDNMRQVIESLCDTDPTTVKVGDSSQI